MKEVNQQGATGEPATYSAPEFNVNPLRLITLGGISGAGDSGAPNIERTPGDGVFDDNADWDFGD